MQARLPALLALLVASTSLAACSASPSHPEEETGQTSQALLPRGTDPYEPVDEEPPTTPTPCPSLRFDIYRSALACVNPPSASGGTWTKEPLFPNAPAPLRDRLAAYTWTPTGNVPNCPAAPYLSIPHTVSEHVGARGHCPLSQPSCRPTVVSVGGPTATMSMKTSTTTTTTSTDSAITGVAPAGSVGCCDACAEIESSVAYVVFPENVHYRKIYFDAYYEGSTLPQRVTVYDPPTNNLQINMDPYRQYHEGMIWAVHTVE